MKRDHKVIVAHDAMNPEELQTLQQLLDDGWHVDGPIPIHRTTLIILSKDLPHNE